MLTLHFAVRQRNLDQLTETLNAVSDPNSPRYGQYLSREEIQALHTDFDAAQAVVQFVTPFTDSCMSGNATVRNTGDFVSVKLSAHAAERMLQTKEYTYITHCWHII
jgi:tripeptidyl-peptidase-1